MDIDKLYRSVGRFVKRAWNQFVSRPVKNYNVEMRAYKVMEKKEAAPWHDSTKQIIEQMKKDSDFEKYNQFDQNLADRLKSVKVYSKEASAGEASDDDGKSKLPSDRFGIGMPYVFLRPEVIPRGKITVLDALDMLINHQMEKTPVKEISAAYGVSEENVEKILKYVGMFKAINKEKKILDLYYLADQLDEPSRIESTRTQRDDGDKRDARMREQAAARAAAAAAKEQPNEEPAQVQKTTAHGDAK